MKEHGIAASRPTLSNQALKIIAMAWRMVGSDLVIGQPFFVFAITPIHYAPRKSGYSAMGHLGSRHYSPVTSYFQYTRRAGIALIMLRQHVALTPG
jgi:hypothetical protein